MSTADWVTALLLIAVVLVDLLCCWGLLAAQSTFDRLHFVGPATTLGIGLLAVAVLVAGSGTQARVKIVLLVAAMMLAGPMVSHATGRAAFIRRHGRLKLPPSGRSTS